MHRQVPNGLITRSIHKPLAFQHTNDPNGVVSPTFCAGYQHSNCIGYMEHFSIYALLRGCGDEDEQCVLLSSLLWCLGVIGRLKK